LFDWWQQSQDILRLTNETRNYVFGCWYFITHISYDIGIKQAFLVILTAVVVTTSFGPD
jgi:hypothetical protein